MVAERLEYKKLGKIFLYFWRSSFLYDNQYDNCVYNFHNIFEFIWTHTHARERIHRVPLFLSVITSLEKRHFAFQHSISSRIPSASSPITMNLSGFPIIFFFLLDEFHPLQLSRAAFLSSTEIIFSRRRRGDDSRDTWEKSCLSVQPISTRYRLIFNDCCRSPPIMEG